MCEKKLDSVASRIVVVSKEKIHAVSDRLLIGHCSNPRHVQAIALRLLPVVEGTLPCLPREAPNRGSEGSSSIGVKKGKTVVWPIRKGPGGLLVSQGTFGLSSGEGPASEESSGFQEIR